MREQMKKAIIATGGHQYLVSEGETLEVEKLLDEKTAKFEAMLVIDGDKVTVGTPSVIGVTVTAEVVAQTRAEKVTAIRYKAKKRVKKVHGHRQHLTQIKITKIA
jgi:large subunit ribosomal protein L21